MMPGAQNMHSAGVVFCSRDVERCREILINLLSSKSFRLLFCQETGEGEEMGGVHKAILHD